MASEPESFKPTKTMLVAWALGEKGGDRDAVDKCDVAVYAYQAYPAYFGFQKYPEYPDVDAVRVQLDDMMKTKYSRPFGLDSDVPITEKARLGAVAHWKLTPHGRKWYEENRSRIQDWVQHNAESNFGTTKPQHGPVKTEEDAVQAWVAKIKGTPGYQKWLTSPNVTRRQVGLQTFFTAFGIGPRTRRPDYLTQREKMARAVAADKSASDFLQALDKMFGDDYAKILTGEAEL